MTGRAAIIVHGGAGSWPDPLLSAAQAGCDAALRRGWSLLCAGAGALDAVQAAVQALEDDPCFNAGTGSVLNARGRVEMDASIMDGATQAAGAVAAVRRIANPVLLARRVLEDGRHVLLAGAGAQAFAREAGLPPCEERALVVPRQRRRWLAARHGTVGCVARDRDGGLAAATSSGGISGKRPGRVGDSALIGCGTFADARVAVSCTGRGEDIIRMVLARRAAEWVERGADPARAAEQAVALLAAQTGGEAGLILVDASGRLGHATNAPHMPVAAAGGQSQT